MEEEQFYNSIQKALDNIQGNVSILEEQIDIEIQLQYFNFVKKQRQQETSEEYMKSKDELFDPGTETERKKEILAGLAGTDDVQAFRVIEKYLATPDPGLKEWAVLAYQESRMLMHSSLLDEQQVFISTGLGGKGRMLRYFIVFIGKTRNKKFSVTQQKLVEDEMDFVIKKQQGELEETSFMHGFVSFLVLLPLTAVLQTVFRTVIDECNALGNFLEEDFIVTNVKAMDRGEIIDLITRKDKMEK